jgi:hypothetical protein
MSELKVNRWLFEDTNTPVGCVVQVQHYTTGAVLSNAATIPADDTIPQSTEGTEAMTLSITPKAATNKLKITVNLYVVGSVTSSVCIGALFRDSGVNALVTNQIFVGLSGNGGGLTIIYYDTANTTTQTTYKVRIGCNSGTITMNGTGGARRFGGTAGSSITIEEIQA